MKKLTIFLLAFTAITVEAKTLWKDSSLSILYGRNYELDYTLSTDDSERTVITFEHVSGHTWGDYFMFIDRLDSGDDSKETYMEISPRLSLGKTMDKEMKFGPITDVLIAATWESASFDDPDNISTSNGSFDNYLYGVGLDWSVPGFAYFQTNMYYRNNEFLDDQEQLTVVWGFPFKTGNLEWMYDGFWDWRSANSDYHAESNMTSQLKADIGKFFWATEKPIYLGIEYVWWEDKFGIENGVLDSNESNINALLKFHW